MRSASYSTAISSSWIAAPPSISSASSSCHEAVLTLIPVQHLRSTATRLTRNAFESAEDARMKLTFLLLLVTCGMLAPVACAGGYYVAAPPPPPRYGVVGYAPGPGYVWA